MPHSNHHFFAIIAICSFLLLILISLFTMTPRLTGNIIVYGGNITGVNLNVNASQSSWFGVFGRILPNATPTNYSLTADQVIEINLTYSLLDNQTLVYASESNSPNWQNISEGSHSLVNAFLGLGAAHLYSSQNTFTQRVNFTIGGSLYELWTATTNSLSGTYQTGLLESNGSLIFVTKVVENGTGFSGKITDYQMILPVQNNGSANFTFFVYQDSFPSGSNSSASCNASINLTAVLHTDNSSVYLNWEDIGADSYEVHYINGFGDGSINFSAATSVNLGTSTSWIDNNTGSERLYRINFISGADNCLVNETVGVLELNLSSEYNLVTNPFTATNNSVKETLRSIDGSYTSVNEFDNVLKSYRFYVIVGSNVFKNFDVIRPSYGYWIRTTGNANLKLVGALSSNTTAELSSDYNLLGFPVIDNVASNNTVAYVLSSIDGSYTSVNEFDNVLKSYRFYVIVGSNVFKNFDVIRPGYGYWVRTTSNASLVYQNG